MVLQILALRMCTYFEFLCDDVIIFINFSSQSKYYLDIIDKNWTDDLNAFVFSQSTLNIFSTETYCIDFEIGTL